MKGSIPTLFISLKYSNRKDVFLHHDLSAQLVQFELEQHRMFLWRLVQAVNITFLTHSKCKPHADLLQMLHQMCGEILKTYSN